MSHIFRDGFDTYASVTDSANHWDSLGNGTLGTVTRNGVGQAYTPDSSLNAVGLSKSFGRNSSNTLYITFAGTFLAALSSTSVTSHMRVYDGSSIQCSIGFNKDGSLYFYRGDQTTLLGTYPAAFLGSAGWTHLQIKIVFHGSAGSFTVRRNGSATDDFILSGVNNVTTANLYANKINHISDGSTLTQMTYDDLWIFDDTVVSGEPNSWVGDCRAIQLPATGDNAANFARNAVNPTVDQATITSTQALASGVMRTIFGTSVMKAGTVAKISAKFNAAATGNVKLGIYDATGLNGGPGSLIANGTSNVVNNPVLGYNDFTFSTPPTVTPNVQYWIVAHSDVAATFVSDSSSVTMYTDTRSYASGLESPIAAASLTVTTGKSAALSIVINPAGNYSYIAELLDDAAYYLQSATPGTVDLYTNSGFSAAPAAILGLSVRVTAQKSDAGNRTLAVRLNSGGTVVDLTALALSTSLSSYVFNKDLDPNTGASWSAGAIAALLFGPKVAA